MACVDCAPVTQEYKMLQLRKYVSGEALIAIENFGYSPASKTVWKESITASVVRKPVLWKTWSSNSRYRLKMLRKWNDLRT